MKISSDLIKPSSHSPLANHELVDVLTCENGIEGRDFKQICLKRFAISCIVLLITFLVFEAAVRCLVSTANAPQSYSSNFDSKYAMAITPFNKDASSVMILGDSKIWHTLYPELLDTRLGEAGFRVQSRNLALNGLTPQISRFLLKTAVDHGNKPNLVIYNVSPMLLNKTYYSNPSYTAEGALKDSYMGECLYLESKSLEQEAGCQLKKRFYLFRYRKFVFHQIKAFSKDFFLPHYEPKASPSAENKVESSLTGWSPAYEVFSEARQIYPGPKFLSAVEQGGSLNNFRWYDSPLLQLTSYCQQNHIPLLMVWVPEHPSMKKVYQHFKFPTSGQFANRFQHFEDPQKQTWFVNLQDFDPDNHDYYNPDHQNVPGSLKTTEKFVTILKNEPFKQLLTPQKAGA